MFQLINDEKPTAEDRKMLVYKVLAFIAVAAALAGALYFFAFVPFSQR